MATIYADDLAFYRHLAKKMADDVAALKELLKSSRKDYLELDRRYQILTELLANQDHLKAAPASILVPADICLLNGSD